MPEGIRDVEVQSGDEGQLQEISVTFGPHHALRIYEEDDEVRFRLVATHHGFDATASGDLPTELEDVINLVRKEREDLIVDRIES
ncbi:hypothetical protein [Haloterrigena alkaliphila]|uniref:Uncharacterized protein n=1 Tax=Haloterrigena alkaliphila TaxID=2816475 RepID=A0A8A2V712_9EURY|nr:hypothetical protein [Haloterrigena alkaliphila]QSW97649.1 hypothetical protein J0X25_09460 [Haloterrigena alkaliphila]